MIGHLKSLYPILFLVLIGMGCSNEVHQDINYSSEWLQIEQISPHVYRHISELEISGYGKFSCNVMLVVDGNEVLIFDTPANVKASRELLNWLADSCGLRIQAVVVNHFHDDCLVGLNEFHAFGIPSYAYQATPTLAREAGLPIPKKLIPDSLSLRIGKTDVINFFPGAGHSPDNLVCYVVNDMVLFGGCLVKSVGGGKGNLADADTSKWSESVLNVIQRFPEIAIVIPGHGQPGGPELLDYTMTLFNPLSKDEESPL